MELCRSMGRSDTVPHTHMHSCSLQHFEPCTDIHSLLCVILPFLGCLHSSQQESHRDAGCLVCAPYLSVSLGVKDAVQMVCCVVLHRPRNPAEESQVV